MLLQLLKSCNWGGELVLGCDVLVFFFLLDDVVQNERWSESDGLLS